MLFFFRVHEMHSLGRRGSPAVERVAVTAPVMGNEPQVVEIGVLLLRVLSVSGLFIAVALTYTGGLQGTGDTRSPLYISIVSQIVIPLGLCTVFQATRGLQPDDIWLAIVLGQGTANQHAGEPAAAGRHVLTVCVAVLLAQRLGVTRDAAGARQERHRGEVHDEHPRSGARGRVARFLGIGDPAELIWTRGTTEAINLVAWSWGLANLRAGDEVLLSVMEHHSNLVPWQMLAAGRGATLRYLYSESTREAVAEIITFADRMPAAENTRRTA